MKMRQPKKVLSILFACISGICLLALGLLAVLQQVDDNRSMETVAALRTSAGMRQAVSAGAGSGIASASTAAPQPQPTPEATAPPQPAAPEATAAPQPSPVPIENPYQDSFLANSDMAAWLRIPGTDIDYPVMWTPRDEEYYLYRGFDGSSNRNGCLILDTDSCLEPLTTNLIIHGHNQESGAMFGHLPEYEDYSFYEEHKSITLYTKEQQRNYEVIAVFRSQVYKKTDQVFKYYKFFQADTLEEFDYFYNNIMDMSLYDTGVTAEFGDHFLTLSTCVYHVERGRLVVVAKETQPGDSYLPIRE